MAKNAMNLDLKQLHIHSKLNWLCFKWPAQLASVGYSNTRCPLGGVQTTTWPLIRQQGRLWWNLLNLQWKGTVGLRSFRMNPSWPCSVADQLQSSSFYSGAATTVSSGAVPVGTLETGSGGGGVGGGGGGGGGNRSFLPREIESNFAIKYPLK